MREIWAVKREDAKRRGRTIGFYAHLDFHFLLLTPPFLKVGD